MSTEENVHSLIYYRLKSVGIDSSSDPRDYPDINKALSTASKGLTGNQGIPDHIFKSKDIPVVMEDKIGLSNHCKLSKDDTLSESSTDIMRYAENGVCHYMKCYMQSKKKGYIIGVANSVESEGKFISRPFLGICSKKKVYPLPPLEDFRKLSSRNIGRYLEDCLRYVNNPPRKPSELTPIIEKIDSMLSKAKIRPNQRPILLELCLLAMRNRSFSRTMIGRSNEDLRTIWTYAESPNMKYTSFWSVTRDVVSFITRDKNITKYTKDTQNILRRMMDIIDSAAIRVGEDAVLAESYAFLRGASEEASRYASSLADIGKGKTMLVKDPDIILLDTLLTATECKIYVLFCDDFQFTEVFLHTVLSGRKPSQLSISPVDPLRGQKAQSFLGVFLQRSSDELPFYIDKIVRNGYITNVIPSTTLSDTHARYEVPKLAKEFSVTSVVKTKEKGIISLRNTHPTKDTYLYATATKNLTPEYAKGIGQGFRRDTKHLFTKKSSQKAR